MGRLSNRKMAKKTWESAISIAQRDLNLIKQEKARILTETETVANRVEETQKSMLNMIQLISNKVDYLQSQEKEKERKTLDQVEEKLKNKERELANLETNSNAEIRLLKLKIDKKRAELKKLDDDIDTKTELCESEFSNLSS